MQDFFCTVNDYFFSVPREYLPLYTRLTFAEHGPTRLMLSMLAAMRAVETLSKLVGMVIEPVVRSFFECKSISILPMRPVFWSSRRSSSGPKKSFGLTKNCTYNIGFFYNAFNINLACITYLIVNVWDAPVNMHFLMILFDYLLIT